VILSQHQRTLTAIAVVLDCLAEDPGKGSWLEGINVLLGDTGRVIGHGDLEKRLTLPKAPTVFSRVKLKAAEHLALGMFWYPAMAELSTAGEGGMEGGRDAHGPLASPSDIPSRSSLGLSVHVEATWNESISTAIFLPPVQSSL
jgi:hypothetical protein